MAVFFDGIKEIVLSVGTDIIKESSEEYCDAKKIRKELGEYIERERASFENIDMKLEIDFYSLKDYIEKNLMADFRDSLYGTREKRRAKKQYILEKLYRYTGAENDGRKQYIRKILVRERDYV